MLMLDMMKEWGQKKKEQRTIELCGGVGMLRIFTKETEDHLSLNPTFFKIQKHKILTPVNLEKRRWFHLLLCL